jgi:hypothetical protein
MLCDTMAVLHTFACYYLTNRVEVEAQVRKREMGAIEVELKFVCIYKLHRAHSFYL